MADKFVRVQFVKGERWKLQFRHRDLRDAVKAGGQNISELFNDPFGGWPYLLHMGLRHMDKSMTLDKASDYIETWVDEPDPVTGAERNLDQLREIIEDALMKSNFVKIERTPEKVDENREREGGEGNARPEAD